MSEDVVNRPLDPLTARELEILQFLAAGLSNREIGAQLFLTTGTVKWYTHNIYSKLGVRKRTAAVVQAQMMGLLGSTTPHHLLHETVRKSNLPHLTTSFIGRETDMANVLTMLMDPNYRLVTLVGLGGIGKTRLAIQCAHQVVDAFADGVYFVSLAFVNPHLLASAIADTLELPDFDQGDVNQQLLQALRHKRLLLVLDNFEHLIIDANIVAQILVHAPNVKILVTSREILNLREEWVYALSGLTVPTPDAVDIDTFDASALFIERALQIRRHFSPEAETGWIAQICQLVGGMPLAIELLSPWANVLSCKEIVEELENKYDLLSRPVNDLPERHQNIQTVFDHSWELLSEKEKMTFAKLAVFRSSFSREAGAKVAEASLQMLMSFVSKSLITAVQDQRFDLHPLLRKYAEEKVSEVPEMMYTARLLHSQYFAQLLQRRDTRQSSTSADMQNVWLGFAFAVQDQQVRLIADYGDGLWYHFEMIGWTRVEEDVLRVYHQGIEVLEHINPDEQKGLRYLYGCLANSYQTLRRYEEARTAYKHALAFTAADQKVFRAVLYRKIGATYTAQRSDVEFMFTAYEMAETELGAPPLTDDRTWWHEWIQIQLDAAWAYYIKADIQGMTRQIEKVDSAVQTFGTAAQQSKLLQNRNLIDLRRFVFRNLPEETLHDAVKALELGYEVGDLRETAWLQFNVGFIYLWRDQLEEAERFLLDAVELARKVGDSMGTYTTALAYLPLIYRRRQQVDVVERWALQGLEAAQYAHAGVYIGTSHAHLAWVCLRRGAQNDASYHCDAALSEWAHFPTYPCQWLAHIPRLALALDSSNPEQSFFHAEFMLNLKQQQLLDPLPSILADALRARSQHQMDLAFEYLHNFCQEAKPLGYL
jgi:predicted ATPase/DNA-binding CsgD family transcriptional regulator